MSGGSSEQSAFTLERHRIDNVTESMYYIPNFISNDEETAILQKVTRRDIVAALMYYCLPTSTDPAKQVGDTHTPTAPSSAYPTDSEQHPALVTDACVAYKPSCGPHTQSRCLRGCTTWNQSLPNQ